MIDLVTIAGSPSPASRSLGVVEYAARLAKEQGLHTFSINVRDFNPEDLFFGRVDSPAIQNSIAVLNQAHAVIIATPIYKASYSGLLKAFLDLLPQDILAGKVILPIATGGSPAHLLAIDYALKPVLAALGANHILNGIYVLDSQVKVISSINTANEKS